MDSIKMQVFGGDSYTWAASSSIYSFGGDSALAAPNTTTTYTVTGSNAIGCTANDTLVVTVESAPTITISATPTDTVLYWR